MYRFARRVTAARWFHGGHAEVRWCQVVGAEGKRGEELKRVLVSQRNVVDGKVNKLKELT